MWEVSGGYTGTMPGYHAVSPMADAVAKGIADFDIAEAYRAGRRSSHSDTTGIHTTRYLSRALNLPSKNWKDSIGWIPWDAENESVAKGLEYAYDDWCISLLARAAGDEKGAAEFARKGQCYRNYWDPQTRFMRGRDRDGKWHEPFNPYSSEHRNDDYCEGTAWQWMWFVPHDVEGLMELMGGRDAFVARLDSLFSAESRLEGNTVSSDISGLIGQYAHGNEPSHHIIHLYNYASRPDRTQELVTRVLAEQYRDDPDGLSGNEDCGQMSAWYVLNALGFYQVCAGKPVYSLGRPIFEEAVINLPEGKKFVIKTKHLSPENRYVKRVKLNGRALREPFFTHDDIRNGGVLEFEMTDRPVTALK